MLAPHIADAMPRTKKPRNRTWHPRPSQKAQERILAAIRELIGREDWTMGYAVDLASLAAVLEAVAGEPHLSYPTLRLYLPWMARNGKLCSHVRGVYELPRSA